MYREDLALNNLQGLISHKTKPTRFHNLRVETNQRHFDVPKE